MGKEVNFITKTGLLLALALVIQIGLAPFAQPVVGPLVNMVLLLSVAVVGPLGAAMVGGLTPIVAFLVGIMTLLPVLPVIMMGNVVFVMVLWISRRWSPVIGVMLAALAKFSVMAVGVRILASAFLTNLPPPVIATLSLPQLSSALLGGFMGVLVLRYLPKSLVLDFKKL